MKFRSVVVVFVLAFGLRVGLMHQLQPPTPLVQAFELATERDTEPIAQAVPPETAAEAPLQAPYVPTPQVVVDRMLEMAEVGPEDVVYDLGSGDGRLVITAAKTYGARGVGIEIIANLVEQATINAEAAGVADRVEFRQQDLFETDFSEATVVTLYLLPEINLQLRPLLFEQLQPGTRVISHGFDMGNWQPEDIETVQGPQKLHIIYKWTIPAEIPESLRQ
jgi:SAM-dependent methyltransferase